MKNFIPIFLCTFIVLIQPFTYIIFAGSVEQEIQLLINEVLPNPEGNDSIGEWIELYNYGEQVIDLNGLYLDSFEFKDEILIEPDTFLLIVRNKEEFELMYPELEKSVEANFSLKNTEDSIILSTNNNEVIDSFEYLFDSSLESGISLERKGYLDLGNCKDIEVNNAEPTPGLENNSVEETCVTIPVEEIEDEQNNITPEIHTSNDGDNWDQRTDFIVGETLYLDISINGISDQTITSVQFYLDGEKIDNTFDLASAGEFMVEADVYFEDEAENEMLVSPDIVTIDVISVPLINEIFIDEDEFWIELYNPGPFESNFGQIDLTLNSTSIELHELGGSNMECLEGGKLEIDTYCLVFITDYELIDNNVIALHVAGEDRQSATFLNNSSVNVSKYEDAWTSSLISSKGGKNTYQPTIQISEIYPSPDTSKEEGEWIELYNYGNESIILSNWYFKERASSSNSDFSSTKDYIFNDVQRIIGSGEYLVINESELSISLNNSGDKIGIFDTFGDEIDTLTYNEVNKSNSVIRIEDGDALSNEVFVTTSVTQGNTNMRSQQEGEEKVEENSEVEEVVTEEKTENTVQEEVELITIASAKSLEKNEQVKIRGFVTVDLDTFGSDIFYIQDETSGIKIDLPSNAQLDLDLGIQVEIIGKISESSGEKKINVSEDNFVQTTANKKVQDPLEIELDDLLNESLGKLVRIEGNISRNFATSFDIQSNNVEYRISVLKATDIEIPDKSVGDAVQITGILTLDEDKYKILPRYQRDIEIESVSNESISEVSQEDDIPGSTKLSNSSTSSNVNKTSGSSANNFGTLPVYLYGLPARGVFPTNEPAPDETSSEMIQVIQISSFGVVGLSTLLLLLIYIGFYKRLKQLTQWLWNELKAPPETYFRKAGRRG